jgi:hypothetical protein
MRVSLSIGPALVVAMSAGLAWAGPEPAVDADSWLYPRATFEDGRTRDVTGSVSAMPDGSYVAGDPEHPAPPVFCFAEGHQPTKEEWEMIYAYLQAGYQDRYNLGVRWGGTVGDPINLTWSLVPDGVPLDNGAGNLLFSRMDQLFGATNRATWVARIQSVFDRWQALTGVNYTRITVGGNDWDDGASWGSGGQAGARGDVRIAMRSIDGANGILAFNSFPTAGDMVLDSGENWAASTSNHIFLRNIVAHEHGHGLGLPHVCPTTQTKLMEPNYTGSFDGPRLDDVRGVQHYYGDIDEVFGAESFNSAFDLGTLANGATISRGAVPSPGILGGSVLSLVPPTTGAGNEHDWYKFTLNAPQLVNITVQPVGTVAYADYDQNANGSCQTGAANTDPLRQADIQFTVNGSTGTTIFRTVANTGLGLAETTTGILLNSGISYIDISGQANFSQTQMYTLSVTVQNVNLNPAATDGTFTDKVRITWPTVPDVTGYRVRRSTTNSQGSSSMLADVPAGTNLFDDTTAVTGTTYYYWVQASQTGSTSLRYMHTNGEPGFRGVGNLPPVANAGPDQVVTDLDAGGSESITLNGSGSNDPDGVITNYLWEEGAATLANGPSATANVSLPWGLHTITLTVTDDDGATHSDTVDVRINRRPVANAGPDQTVVDSDNSGSESVTFDGSLSTDPDGTITDYTWREGTNVLASGTDSTPTVAMAVGTWTITLTVTDNHGATHIDTMVLTVEPPAAPCDPDVNEDGNVDQDDVSYLINVVGGGPNPTGIDPDFNQDGNVDQDDISALINVVAGGPCP